MKWNEIEKFPFAAKQNMVGFFLICWSFSMMLNTESKHCTHMDEKMQAKNAWHTACGCVSKCGIQLSRVIYIIISVRFDMKCTMSKIILISSVLFFDCPGWFRSCVWFEHCIRSLFVFMFRWMFSIELFSPYSFIKIRFLLFFVVVAVLCFLWAWKYGGE